jgi:cell division protein FtsW (lipid II flippase)
MSEEKIKELKTSVVVTKSRGKHFNRFLLYAAYIVVFVIIAFFLMLSFVTIEDKVAIGEMWPFIFIVIVLIFCSVVVVERVKTESKRTVQRDMRRL